MVRFLWNGVIIEAAGALWAAPVQTTTPHAEGHVVN